ncbi:MAG TPA: radical SAM protein [Polyangiales bacterium]|nr:radical SAM protein [Polyangiales bacterium]
MKRPVWLFSLDTEEFPSVPMATGGLKACFLKYGKSAPSTEVELVHFHLGDEIDAWVEQQWRPLHLPRARQAVLRGLRPVLGFSVYTWNAAAFLSLIKTLRADCPGALVVVGGPHVQRAQDYLHEDGIDLVVLSEGELTFQEWLDCEERSQWASVQGLAFLGDDGALVRTETRPRVQDLDILPSALDVLELRLPDGRPRFKAVAYETARGCPFKCSFCEWGTGAIGTKFYQHGLPRIQSDFERLVEGGLEDIWLCDSNFGALREDLDKAKILVDLRKRTGRPNTVGTSWSKSHNDRVQEIVLMLKEHGLLFHYNLALQTLTPLALKLSNRKNMRSNQYEPIAKGMAEAGVTIATELIWGLPGDNLADFERNLDRLAGVFPNINIFGYTLLPGTEFFERRDEYEIQTIPVAGYGKAKGEYVIGCHTFDTDEGMEGYFLITAHILLIRGYVLPLTTRLLALDGAVPVSPLLRAVLRELVKCFAPHMPGLDPLDRMQVYERRAEMYLLMLARLDETYEIAKRAVLAWLDAHEASPSLRARTQRVLELDETFCPRVGPSHQLTRSFQFEAQRVEHHLARMELPPENAFAGSSVELLVHHPAHVGEVLKNPDGGSWMRGQVKQVVGQAAAIAEAI